MLSWFVVPCWSPFGGSRHGARWWQRGRVASRRCPCDSLTSSQEMTESVFTGACLCKCVQWECQGFPVWSLICHCSLCRRCHSAPYAEMVAYKPENFHLVKGEGELGMYNVNGTNKEDRHFCRHCGSMCFSILNQTPGKLRAVHLQNFTHPNHGPDGAIDARFASTAHIFYRSGTAVVKDGLPKFETKAGGVRVTEERPRAKL